MKISGDALDDLYRKLRHGDDGHMKWLRDALVAWNEDRPIPTFVPEAPKSPMRIRLNCPTCGELHVDVGVFATKPHHTHSCQHCGLTWRPAKEDTIGVQFIPGFKDES